MTESNSVLLGRIVELERREAELKAVRASHAAAVHEAFEEGVRTIWGSRHDDHEFDKDVSDLWESSASRARLEPTP